MLYEQVYLVGCGGIGSEIADKLVRAMSVSEEGPKRLVLVDGDKTEEKNLERQSFAPGDVGRPKVEGLAKRLSGLTANVTVDTIGRFLAERPREDDSVHIDSVLKDKSVIVTGLDNAAARIMISDFARRCEEAVVINCGNEGNDGHAYTYVVSEGVERHRRIEDHYGLDPSAKSDNPGDLSCADRQKLPGGHQVMAANVRAAAEGFAMFSRLLHALELGKEEVKKEFSASNEVIFSTKNGSAVSYSHPKRVRKPRTIVERRND